MSSDLEVRELKLQLQEAQFELKKLKFDTLLRQAGFTVSEDGGEKKTDFSFDAANLGIHNIVQANNKLKDVTKSSNDDYARVVYKELAINAASWNGDGGWDRRVNISCRPLETPRELIIDCSAVNIKAPLASLLFDTPNNPIAYPGLSYWLSERTEKMPKLNFLEDHNGEKADFKLFLSSETVQREDWIQIYGPGTHPMLNIMNGVLTLGHFIHAMIYGEPSFTWNCANIKCEHYKNECPVHTDINYPSPVAYNLLHRTDDDSVKFQFRLGLKWEKINGDDYL
jgi:hypothetical protein